MCWPGVCRCVKLRISVLLDGKAGGQSGYGSVTVTNVLSLELPSVANPLDPSPGAPWWRCVRWGVLSGLHSTCGFCCLFVVVLIKVICRTHLLQLSFSIYSFPIIKCCLFFF